MPLPKYRKKTQYFCRKYLCFLMNLSIKKNPGILKQADIIEVFIKVIEKPKTVIDLEGPCKSFQKILKNLICRQLTLFLNKHLSKFSMVLEKRYSSEHCLSKAFDYSSHELITTKLYAHGVSFNSIKLINNHLLHTHKNLKHIILRVHGKKYSLGGFRILY